MGEAARICCLGTSEALSAQLAETPHVLVADASEAELCILGGASLEELLPRVSEARARDLHLPLLLRCPVREPRAIVAAVRAGATDWIPPEATAAQVAEILESALLRSRLARERAGMVDFLQEHDRSLAEDRALLQRRLAELATELEHTHDQLETAHRQLRGRVSQLVMLYQIGRDLTARPNWDEALQSFLTTLTGFLGADGASLYLTSAGGARVTARSVFQLDEPEVEQGLDWAGRRAKRSELDTDFVRARRTEAGFEIVPEPEPWNTTFLPLCQRDRELGYLQLKKHYVDREAFENDYYFLITIQTVLTEEVGSAQAMSELRKLKEFHERTFDHVRSGIFTVDAGGSVGFANRRVRELFGRDPAGILVAEFLDLGPEAPAVHTWMNGVVTGSTRSVDAWLRPMNGSASIPVSLVGSPLPGELPGETNVVCVLEDQRQTRALDAERRRASRQQEHLIMAAEWAHDVRTPLTGILHSAELLADALDESSPKRRHFDVVQGEVRRINELVSNFLDYARPIEVKARPIRLGDLLSSVVELQKGPAEACHLDLRLDTNGAGECVVEVDGDAMRQVLLNLIQNAFDVSPERSEVVVRSDRVARDSTLDGENSVRVDVIDAGPGVAAENVDRLFIPFFTTKAQGTGLGLAISEKVARAHGGHLRYLRENERTVMRIVLPDREGDVAAFDDNEGSRRGTESELEAKG